MGFINCANSIEAFARTQNLRNLWKNPNKYNLKEIQEINFIIKINAFNLQSLSRLLILFIQIHKFNYLSTNFFFFVSLQSCFLITKNLQF